MAGNAIEAGGGNQPQVQVSMSHTPSRNISPKRPEESNVQSQSAQSSPKQDVAAQPQPQQIGQNYNHHPVQKNLQSINGAIQTNGQQQQPLQQMPMQRVPSLGIISLAVHASVGDTPQISPKDNNLQFAQPVQQNLNLNPGQQQVQMHVLQQAPQQTLFQQHHQQHQHQQQQQQQIGQHQQHIINQQFLGQQTFSLQQQPIMFQPQMIPQQQFQQQQHQQSQQQHQQVMQQQMYQPRLQQHVAMVQAPVLYAAQSAAVVSNPAAATAGGPASANNTPVSKAVKKGRFRVVKPGKQDANEIGDGQSVVSALSENPGEPVAPAVTTKKKGRFLIKTKSVNDTGKLSPTKESVSDANKSDADDAVSKGGGLPPQLPTSSDKAAGANNVKKKGRFRVKSGLNLADAEASLASDKPDAHVRRPSEDTLQSIPRISSEVTADENAPSIASNTQVPATTTNTQVPQGMDGVGGNNNAFPQYTTFVPSMTSYDVNNQVMMVSAPFLTAQNTSMPMMQTSVQQSQMQQMYQNQVQAQQQQQQQPQQQVPPTQQPEQNAAPSSHPMGLPLSNPNSPNPRTEPTQTQPQVPLLPQQSRSGSPIPKRPTASSVETGTNSGSAGWRGISGSHGKNGRLIGCGGVGKILHNLDSLRQEILDADKSMTSLQSDNRFLRNKNKELESKISNLEKRLAEEKSLRRSTDAKVQSLRQKVKELEPSAHNDAQAGEETIASDGKQVSKTVEEKSTGTQTALVAKPQEPDDCDGGQESKLQTSPPKKCASLYKVEGEPKPNSPLSIRRALTGSESMSDLYIASLAKSQEAAAKQFDPLAALAPPLCPPTSSVAMAQNFQSLVDNDNIAPIPMIVTTQKMPPSDVENTIEAKGNENGQHFDPLGTPEKSQSQLNIQTLVLNPMIPSVPTLTHLNGSPAMATVPVYTLPIPTIQLPPQHQQGQPKQAEHDPFDDIICRGQNGEQNGNGYHDCMR